MFKAALKSDEYKYNKYLYSKNIKKEVEEANLYTGNNQKS